MLHNEINLRMERLALCIGQVVGQISQLLNSIKSGDLNRDYIYRELLDISNAAGVHLHELYYKHLDKPE
jgi:hypothetical protein